MEHNKLFSWNTEQSSYREIIFMELKKTLMEHSNSFLRNRNPFHGETNIHGTKNFLLELSNSFCGTQQICFMQETFHEAAKLFMEHNKSYLWNTTHLFVKFSKNREHNKSGLTQVDNQYQS